MVFTPFELRVVVIFQFSCMFHAERQNTIFCTNSRDNVASLSNKTHGGYFQFFDDGRVYLACDEFPGYAELRKHAPTDPVIANLVGWFLGSLVSGSISFAYGRKSLAVVSLIFGGVVLTLNAFVHEYTTFCALRFLLGVCHGSFLVASWSLVCELIQPASRLPTRAFASWPNVRFMFAIVFFTIGNWRLTALFSAMIAFGSAALYHYCLPESPIWLATKGHKKECDAVLDMLKKDYNYEITVSTTTSPNASLGSLLKNTRMLPILLVLAFFWAANPYMDFSTDFSNVNPPGVTLEQTQIMVPLVQAIMKTAIGWIQINRRPFKRTHMQYVVTSIVIIFSIAALVLSIVQSQPSYKDSLSLKYLYFIILLGAMIALEFNWDVCYLVTVEVIPTEFRSTVLSVYSSIARLGIIVAKLVVNGQLNGASVRWVNWLVVICLSTISIVLGCLFLRNTENVKLAEVPINDTEEAIDCEATMNTHINDNKIQYENEHKLA